MRRLLVIALASLAALGGVAFAVQGLQPTDKRGRFTLSVSPARQSAVRGGVATFSVSLVRARGFAGVTALRVAGLPPGVRPLWRLTDGTRGAVVPPGDSGAILTLRTSARTPLGRRRVTVLATGDGATRIRAFELSVEPPASIDFSLQVSPARQIVPQGATATYAVRVARTASLHMPVALRLLRLPRGAGASRTRGASASRTRAALTVATSAGQRLGSYRLLVEGSSRVAGRTVRRYAVVVLTVVEAHPFRIGGDLSAPLYPGGGAPLDLVLTNPNRFDIRVTALNVRVGTRTTNPDCSGEANYAVTQYGGDYPLVLRPGDTRLSALVPDPAAWPQVSMHNLPTNQDACRGAVLSLDYSGLAAR